MNKKTFILMIALAIVLTIIGAIIINL